MHAESGAIETFYAGGWLRGHSPLRRVLAYCDKLGTTVSADQTHKLSRMECLGQ